MSRAIPTYRVLPHYNPLLFVSLHMNASCYNGAILIFVRAPKLTEMFAADTLLYCEMKVSIFAPPFLL